MKRVLIVCPRWLPLSAPDLQRVRMSLPHYRACGWNPVLLCVDSAQADGVIEPELGAILPADLPIYRCGAVSRALCRIVGVGSLGLRSWRHLWRSGLEIIKRERIDLVFVSTTEFVATFAARLWKRDTGIPYVIDIQDPWQTSHYEDTGTRPPGGWKYGFARMVGRVLEEPSFSRASGFMSVSPRYLDDLRHRYPWMGGRPSDTIEFGGSREDLAAASAGPAAPIPALTREHGEVHLVYTGAAGPIGLAAIEAVLQSLHELARSQPVEARRLHLHFVGTTYAAVPATASDILPLAARLNLQAQVHETTGRITYLQSLRWQSQADGLLLLAAADPAYSPSKLHPYFLSGRPILAVVRERSLLRDLLRPLGGCVVAVVEDSPASNRSHPKVLSFLQAALKDFPPGAVPPRETAYFHDHYSVQTLTRRQCELFDRVTRSANDQAPTSSHEPR